MSLVSAHGVELLPNPVRAPSQLSNFSRTKGQRWVQNLRECWKNCNLQFSFFYTNYIAAIFKLKSVFYIYFRSPDFC